MHNTIVESKMPTVTEKNINIHNAIYDTRENEILPISEEVAESNAGKTQCFKSGIKISQYYINYLKLRCLGCTNTLLMCDNFIMSKDAK